jgi:hypothetical protein
MSKAKKILTLLSKGKTIKEVAKATKSKPAYVYYVRWIDAKQNKQAPKKAKKKAVYKSERSKLIQDVFQMKKALDVVEPKRVMINLARRKDGAIIDLNKGGEVISPPDPVNHPPHYTIGGIETLDFIEAKDLNYRLGNVVKYVSRAGKKSSDPVQDLEKAAFYLKREIDARKNA